MCSRQLLDRRGHCADDRHVAAGRGTISQSSPPPRRNAPVRSQQRGHHRQPGRVRQLKHSREDQRVTHHSANTRGFRPTLLQGNPRRVDRRPEQSHVAAVVDQPGRQAEQGRS